MRFHKLSATAAALLTLGSGAFAADMPSSSVPPMAESAINSVAEMTKQVSDALGIKLWGYARGGFYTASNRAPNGGYTLGGDLQKYRLGNEGDNYIEFGLGKTFDLGSGLKWGVYYMPYVYQGKSGTQQIYSDITGLAFAPEATVWAGQRYHRIQDIHVIDNWVMQDGDNYGAGIDGLKLGSSGAKLNLAAYTEGSIDNHDTQTNAAKRFNAQVRNIPTWKNGTLNLTGGLISGDFKQGSDGAALGLLHNQNDFIFTGMINSLFVQGSRGHASINGKFYGLDSAAVGPSLVQSQLGTVTTLPGTPAMSQPGAKQGRIVDVLNWQSGRFGGQALIGYQTLQPDNGVTLKDFSLGGRVSYGIARNTKLLAEVGTTSRKTDGQETQRLNKATLAVALAPNTDFWTRPEFRLYVTRASWNDAASLANSSGFGANGRKSATTLGAQVEVWWE